MAGSRYRTIADTVALPPASPYQMVVALAGLTPRQLWVEHGLGFDAELVDVRAAGPRSVRISTWRTFDDAGNVTVALEPRSRPGAILFVWFNPDRYWQTVHWRLSTKRPLRATSQIDIPRPPELEPTSFERVLAQEFGVSPGELMRAATGAADRYSLSRSELLGWVDAQPWFEIRTTYRSILSIVEQSPFATSAFFLAAARVIHKRS